MPLQVKKRNQLQLRTRTGKIIKSAFVTLSSRPRTIFTKTGLNKLSQISIFVPTTPHKEHKTLQLRTEPEHIEKEEDKILKETSAGMLSGKGGESVENVKETNEAKVVEKGETSADKSVANVESKDNFNLEESMHHPVKVDKVEMKRLLANFHQESKPAKKSKLHHSFKLV